MTKPTWSADGFTSGKTGEELNANAKVRIEY